MSNSQAGITEDEFLDLAAKWTHLEWAYCDTYFSGRMWWMRFYPPGLGFPAEDMNVKAAIALSDKHDLTLQIQRAVTYAFWHSQNDRPQKNIFFCEHRLRVHPQVLAQAASLRSSLLRFPRYQELDQRLKSR